MRKLIALIFLAGLRVYGEPPPLPALISAPSTDAVAVVISSKIIGNTNFQYWGTVRSSNWLNMQVVNLTNQISSTVSHVVVSWDDPQTILSSPDLSSWGTVYVSATRSVTLPLQSSQFFRVPIQPQTVSINWDASQDPQVVGYNLYRGPISDLYDSKTDEGTNGSATIPNLQPGATYYFAVTAYDGTGRESAYSNEVSYSVPNTNAVNITAK